MGRERDLRFLASAIRDPWRITEEDGKFYLRSSRFEGLNDAGEVKRLADEFFDCADLVARVRFEGYQRVHTAEVVGIKPDGAHHATIAFAVGHAEGVGSAMAVGVAEVVGSPVKPQPPDLTRDTSLLKQRLSLAKALRHLREEPNWYGYLKATEALGEEICGLKNVVNRGWATKDEWDRFYHTVHYHRHHRKPAPPNPMSEGEAKSFLLGLLRSCADWRLSQGR
jgi:hypothetical protein